MDTGTERYVPVDLAVDDDLVGMLECGWVPVRSWERQDDTFAFFDPTIAEHGVLGRDSGHGDRGVGPKEFFDCSWDQLRGPGQVGDDLRGGLQGAIGLTQWSSTSCRYRRST